MRANSSKKLDLKRLAASNQAQARPGGNYNKTLSLPKDHRCSMSLASLQQFFDTSPVMHLLRSPHAAWILDFLHQQFKLSGQLTQSHASLVASLESQLLTVAPNQPQLVPDASPTLLSATQRAEAYLATWSSADCGWLKRFIDSHSSEPSYQLTSATEVALAFALKASRPVAVVGTRSHLRSVLRLLSEVVQEQGDAEMAREQFSLAVSQLEQLTSQFREVEEHFKSIAQGIQQRLLAATSSRGDIVQFALDAEEILKTGEQGRSFFEFLRLVHNPDSQARIAQLVTQVTQLEALADRQEEMQSIRTMIPRLLAEAEKILRTTQHLSQTLRRLLDARSTRHHQQLSQVLRDIRAQAAALSRFPPRDVSLEVEAEIEIRLPCDRPLWSQAEPFADVPLQLAEIDPLEQALATQQLLALERIDWQTLRRNISLLTQQQAETTLSQLLERFPLQSGTIELLAYLQIAHEDGHTIDTSRQIQIATDWEGPRSRWLRLPQVIFRPQRSARAAPSVTASLSRRPAGDNSTSPGLPFST